MNNVSQKITPLQQAFDLWMDFKDEILYKNRLIIEHTILDSLKRIAEGCKKSLEKGTILYRARIFNGDNSFVAYLRFDFNMDNNDESIKRLSAYRNKAYIESMRKSGFWGYNEDDLFIPKDNNLAGEGRANPAFIKYLYAAETPYTALAEVRPYLKAEISVAEIIITHELTIADFSYQGIKISNVLDEKLMYLIMLDFSEPINTNKKDYIPTQYIAEY
ncbi:MAG: hypothetical protein ACI8WT_005008 [Clostridium sp.]|jgi:hypothetical protein